MNTRIKNLTVLFIISTLMLTILSLSGCKKKSEPAATAPAETTETKQVVSKVAEAAEQTKCPVMDGPINKNLYTEYKGKKVYFCCAGCKETFEKEPDKYIPKLPQFGD